MPQTSEPLTLDTVYEPVLPLLEQVEIQLLEILPPPDHFIGQITRYYFGHSGKRLRPALVFLAAGTGPLQDPAARKSQVIIATAIELVHTATLMHDDVLDDARLRRGQPSANQRWGNEATIIAGDFLYARAFRILAEHRLWEALDVLSAVTEQMSLGELDQLSRRGAMNLTEAFYFDVVRRKTATLIAAAAALGAGSSRAHPQQVEALRNYGDAVGIAFQVMDDYLDLVGEENVVGKSLGSDIAKGKLTLPLIELARMASESDRLHLKSLFGQEGHSVKDLLKRYPVHDRTLLRAEEFVSQAIESLRPLGSFETREHLVRLARYVTVRNK